MPDRFIEIATVVVSGLTGLIIGIPGAMAQSSAVGAIIPVVTCLLGALIGYRKRKSRAFFYLSLFIVMILLSLIGSHLGEIPQ